MKRINDKTKAHFKSGDLRDDGFVFAGYDLNKLNPDGFFAERWMRPEVYAKRKANNTAAVNTKRRSSRVEHARDVFTNRKHYAKKYGVDFTIDVDYVIDRITDCCPILGIEFGWCNYNGGKPAANSPTLDRIDPMLGYVDGNVVWVSHRANTIKNNGTASEHRLVADYMDRMLMAS